MLRHRLTDEQWELIADLSPKPKRSGRSPRDRRQIMDGILWIRRTGSPRRDLPQEFGPWAAVWDLFDKWNADGTLQAIPCPANAQATAMCRAHSEGWKLEPAPWFRCAFALSG